MWGFCCSLAWCLHCEPLLAQYSVLLSEHSVGNKHVSFKGCVKFCLPRIPISVCCPPQMYFVYIRRTEIRVYGRLNRRKHIKRDSKGCKLFNKNIKSTLDVFRAFQYPNLIKLTNYCSLAPVLSIAIRSNQQEIQPYMVWFWGTNCRFCSEVENSSPGILSAVQFQQGNLSQCSLVHSCTSTLFKMQSPLKGRVNNLDYYSSFICKNRQCLQEIQTLKSELNTCQSKD